MRYMQMVGSGVRQEPLARWLLRVCDWGAGKFLWRRLTVTVLSPVTILISAVWWLTALTFRWFFVVALGTGVISMMVYAMVRAQWERPTSTTSPARPSVQPKPIFVARGMRSGEYESRRIH